MTVAKEVKSDFCTLFESIPGSFEGFAYAGDLDKFYGTGFVIIYEFRELCLTSSVYDQIRERSWTSAGRWLRQRVTRKTYQHLRL